MATVDIAPSSQQGQALQAAIQQELVSRGWTSDDDPVMAEYCLVMLGNRKTADQIRTELSDLIPGDFEDSFLEWLFAALDQIYVNPSTAQPSTLSSAAAPFTPSAGPPTLEVRGAAGGPPTDAPTGPRSVSGMKRGREGSDQGQAGNQRQRFDGVPNGPRNMNGPGGPRVGTGGKALFDRMGPAPPGGPNFSNGAMGGPGMGMNMPPQAFEAIAQTIQAVVSGATPPSSLAAIPFPALASHPHANRLPPQVMQHAQAHAMAQAQAFMAMQSPWGAGPAFPPQQGGHGFGQPHRGGPGAGRGGFRGANGQGGHQAGGPAQPKPAAPLPTAPTDESLCKHGVGCTKPACPFSHPSPVATKESGLVLSSEHCKNAINCTDPDCPNSHVSPAQKNPPPAAAAAPAAPAAPAADPNSIAGAGEKACKFGSACTRKDCVFVHPWDQRDGLGATGGTVPCRWGAQCTRAGCHFSHPPNRANPGSKPKAWASSTTPTWNAANFTATFNGAGAKKPAGAKEGAIGEWPKEEKDHVSDRLKRFAQEGETEKIIPGEVKTEIEPDDSKAE